MKTAIMFLSCFCLLYSCSVEEAPPLPFDLKSVEFKSVGAHMAIPAQYRHGTVQELIELWQSSDIPSGIKDKVIHMMKILQDDSTSTVIYVDSTDLENSIWVQESPYFPMNESLARQFINSFEHRFQKEWEPLGVSFNEIESAYIENNRARAIKLKYFLKVNDHSRFTTQYLITSQDKTISIIVNNRTMEDYEELIRGIQIE